MDVHKRHNLTNAPVCFQNEPTRRTDGVIMADDINDVTCFLCLRMLARDAVIYGNQRRPKRKW